jgi:hypothetical protein
MSNKTDIFRRLFSRKPAIHHIGVVVIAWTLICEVHGGNLVHITSYLTSCEWLFTLRLVLVCYQIRACPPFMSIAFCFCFLIILFSDAVSFWDHVALMIEDWMNVEHWWNNTNRGKLKYSKKNLFHCHFFHHRHHMHWAGIVPAASALRDEQLTTWAMARPDSLFDSM